MYYLKLRLSVLIGLHHTDNPLHLRWRWHHWNYIYKKKHSI